VTLVYDQEQLNRFCREHGIARLELFGSALDLQKFGPASDVDLLCTLRPERRCTLLDWADMSLRLAGIFHRPVDLVSRRAIEQSRNPYRKAAILADCRNLYVEG